MARYEFKKGDESKAYIDVERGQALIVAIGLVRAGAGPVDAGISISLDAGLIQDFVGDLTSSKNSTWQPIGVMFDVITADELRKDWS